MGGGVKIPEGINRMGNWSLTLLANLIDSVTEKMESSILWCARWAWQHLGEVNSHCACVALIIPLDLAQPIAGRLSCRVRIFLCASQIPNLRSVESGNNTENPGPVCNLSPNVHMQVMLLCMRTMRAHILETVTCIRIINLYGQIDIT